MFFVNDDCLLTQFNNRLVWMTLRILCSSGYGTNPPQRPHHRGASCPNRPAPCGFNEFFSPNPNPQVGGGGAPALKGWNELMLNATGPPQIWQVSVLLAHSDWGLMWAP